MMIEQKRKAAKLMFSAVAAAASAWSAAPTHAATLAQWSFTSTQPQPPVTIVGGTTTTNPNASPNTQAPTSGSGLASQLGMMNSYTYAGGEGPGSAAGCDVVATSGTAHSSFTEDTWRIRGISNASGGGPGSANGWNNSAPNYTQGAEFATPTAGYNNIQVSFDWYSTTQGVGNMQVLYTTDGSTWIPVGSDLIATSNDYYGMASGSPTNTITLPASVTTTPNFAVELVSVKPVPGDSDYSATGPGGDGNYAAAAGDTSAATAVDYNNNSGNWRFDNITISGTAVPEPASLGLLGLGGLSLLRRRRSR